MTLPNYYIPGEGEKPVQKEQIIIPEVRFAVGILHVGTLHVANEMGMTHGPFKTLVEALDCEPSSPCSFIVFLAGDKFYVHLYRWHNKKEAWVLLNKDYHWLYHPESDCIFIDTLQDREQISIFECDDYGMVRNFDQKELNIIYSTVYKNQKVELIHLK